MIWTPQETSTHQDHVIAHVIGATVLGYFVFDESIYLLLDIGFFWRVYLDGEMGLLPIPVTIHELEVELETKQQLRGDCDRLGQGLSTDLEQMTRAPGECAINEITLLRNGEDWRLLLQGDEYNLAIEAAMATRTLALSVS